MIRWMIQTVLCLFLSPLLAAQQVASPDAASTSSQQDQPVQQTAARPTLPEFITIPKNTKIELVALDSVSSATATVGSDIRLAVVNDVMVNGVTVIHAGTPVTGTITNVKRGSHKMNRNGRVNIRARDLQSGKQIKVHLTDVSPVDRIPGGNAWNSSGKEVWIPVAVIATIVLLVLLGGW
jgi:hypothetical protein